MAPCLAMLFDELCRNQPRDVVKSAKRKTRPKLKFGRARLGGKTRRLVQGHREQMLTPDFATHYKEDSNVAVSLWDGTGRQ
jgi:hypothetical protein